MPSREELILELQRLAKELGKCPSFLEARRLGKFSTGQYMREFGSWNKALASLGIPFFIPPSWTVSNLSPYDGGWLAGLIDGEGCLRIAAPSPNGGRGKSRSFSCGLQLSLRDDDMQVLQRVAALWDLKFLPHSCNLDKRRSMGQKVGDTALLDVRDMPTLWFKVIPTLELYPLQSRKKNEFIVFRAAIRILYEKACRGQKNLRYSSLERDILLRCRLALKEAKIWKADFQSVVAKYGLEEIIK